MDEARDSAIAAIPTAERVMLSRPLTGTLEEAKNRARLSQAEPDVLAGVIAKLDEQIAQLKFDSDCPTPMP